MHPEILTAFRQVLEALRRALAQPKDEYLRDSVIQRFEFTYELAWFRYHQARNETVPTYKEAKAEEVYTVASAFQTEAGKLLERLEARRE